MKKWEYKICPYPECRPDGIPIAKTPQAVEAMLNKLGAEGWELISHGGLSLSITHNAAYGAFTFKRPID